MTSEEKPGGLKVIELLVQTLTAEQREKFLWFWRERWCLHCGADLPCFCQHDD